MSLRHILKKGPLGPLTSVGFRALKNAALFPLRQWRQAHPGTTILLYHRVAELSTDPHTLAISSHHFEAQLEYIAKHYHVLSMAEFAESVKNRRAPRHSLVITFDDGYEDNYLNAFPLLKKYNLPATIFVAGSNTPTAELWWDELAQLINPTSDGYRRTFIDLKGHTAAEREKRFTQLATEKRVVRTIRPNFRRCSTEQLTEMIGSGLITIGGHTVSHSQLSSLSLPEQESEIKTNLDFITSLGHQPTIPFAYPFGGRDDFNQETVALVEKHFPLALTAYKGHLTAGTNRYRLPRFVVKDWDGPLFAEKLQEFFSFV